jgi:hypothetical protein
VIFLLSPLEILILKNNLKVVHRFISEHYQLEDNHTSSMVNLEALDIYNNEIPYFEINLSTLNSTDWLFTIITGFVLLLFVLPFCLYQVAMFTAPVLLKNELRALKTIVIYYTISSILIFMMTSTTIIGFLIRSYLVSTQEIGYYEFEIEFNIGDYLKYYLNILAVHNIMILSFYTKKNKKSNTLFIAYSLIFVSLFSETMVIWLYYIGCLVILITIKKLITVALFLKYQNCVRMNGNSKLYSLLF